MTQDTRIIMTSRTALGYSWTLWNTDGTIDSSGDGYVSLKAADEAAREILAIGLLLPDPMPRPVSRAISANPTRITGGFP